MLPDAFSFLRPQKQFNSSTSHGAQKEGICIASRMRQDDIAS